MFINVLPVMNDHTSYVLLKHLKISLIEKYDITCFRAIILIIHPNEITHSLLSKPCARFHDENIYIPTVARERPIIASCIIMSLDLYHSR